MNDIIADSIIRFVKIILIVFVSIIIVRFFKTYIDKEKLKNKILASSKINSYILAAFLGATTTFGDEDEAPLFLGLYQSGFRIGPAFSFLIASPLINEYIIILIAGFFGIKIALAYVLSGMVMAIASGLVISALNLDEYIIKDYRKKDFSQIEFKTPKQRAKFALKETKNLILKIWYLVAAGVIAGSFIREYMTQSFIETIIKSIGIWGIPLAIIIAIPLRGTGSAIIPVALALFEKGIPLGAALAFLMALVGLSISEYKKLSRVMKKRPLWIFFSIVTYVIIIIGYILSFIKNF